MGVEKVHGANRGVTGPGFLKGIKHEPQKSLVIKTKEKQLTTEDE